MASTYLQLNDRLYDYLQKHSLRETDLQRRLREETSLLPLGVMQISAVQGQFMTLLMRLMNARKTIEVGVFTGYSTLCTALGLADGGSIIACDISSEWTSIGKRFWAEAGVAEKIRLRLAPATETLDALIAAGEDGTFDFAFIDADKVNYDAYYERSIKLVRIGGVIAFDNTLWGGKVADDSEDDADTRAIRALNDRLHHDDRIMLSQLPVGDGLSLALRIL